MTIAQFRALLTDYLTDPDYAEEVTIIGVRHMGVTLDDGSRFFVCIDKMAGDSPFPEGDDA